MSDEAQQPAPLTPGARLRVTITDVAFGGEGVARVDDFVVFVPFVLEGEEVEVEITEVKKRFARARLLQVLQASPERVAPACRYFGECGGCQYQHISYPAQVQIKHRQIVEVLRRIGGLDPAVVRPVVPCPQPYGYRNRIMVRSQWDKFKQGLNIGFLRHDNRLVVDIEECKIAEPAISDRIPEVRADPPPRGGLKVVLRLAPEDWEVPQDSFFQNNFHLLPKLVESVRLMLRGSGVRHLIDAYCGVGFFAIELGDLVESFAGVEVDLQAIRAARRNATRRQRTNGEFVVGRAEDLLPDLLRRSPPAVTAVVLDPPRTGCGKAILGALCELRPAQVIYVSCHPATLARDLNALSANGVYTVAQVVPLDMFPQTQHVECVADVRRHRVEGDAVPAAERQTSAVGAQIVSVREGVSTVH